MSHNSKKSPCMLYPSTYYGIPAITLFKTFENYEEFDSFILKLTREIGYIFSRIKVIKISPFSKIHTLVIGYLNGSITEDFTNLMRESNVACRDVRELFSETEPKHPPEVSRIYQIYTELLSRHGEEEPLRIGSSELAWHFLLEHMDDLFYVWHEFFDIKRISKAVKKATQQIIDKSNLVIKDASFHFIVRVPQDKSQIIDKSFSESLAKAYLMRNRKVYLASPYHGITSFRFILEWRDLPIPSEHWVGLLARKLSEVDRFLQIHYSDIIIELECWIKHISGFVHDQKISIINKIKDRCLRRIIHRESEVNDHLIKFSFTLCDIPCSWLSGKGGVI